MKNYLLILLSLLVITGCKDYKIEDDKVYIKGWNEAHGSFKTLVEGADGHTFQKLDSEDNMLLGKDKNHVYIDWEIINNCDPKTIKYLGNYYCTTKDSVYFFGFYNDINNCEVIGANPATIEIASQYPWAHDDKHIIYGQTSTASNDLGSFTPLSETWAKTATEVFFNGKPVSQADAATFKVLDDENGRDKARHYHRDRFQY